MNERTVFIQVHRARYVTWLEERCPQCDKPWSQVRFVPVSEVNWDGVLLHCVDGHTWPAST